MTSSVSTCFVISFTPSTLAEPVDWPGIPVPIDGSFQTQPGQLQLRWEGSSGCIRLSNVYHQSFGIHSFGSYSESGLNPLRLIESGLRIDVFSSDLSTSFLSHQFHPADLENYRCDYIPMATPAMQSLLDDVRSREGLSSYLVFVSVGKDDWHASKHISSLPRAPFLESKTVPSSAIEQWNGYHRTRHPHDVKFSFDGAKELWESAHFLRSRSAYWTSLFSSGFSESVKGPESRASHEEYDDLDISEQAASVEQLEPNRAHEADCQHPIHTVRIQDPELYEPYRATLCWLRTGKIKFSPLRIDCFPSDAASTIPTSRTPLDKSSPGPEEDLAICPKPIYRLAHFLQLEELRQIALKSIVSQLNAGNVALELFGQLAADYDKIRDKAFEFAIQKWPEVKKTEGMQNVQRWVQEGRLPSAIQLLLQVSMAL